MRETNMRAELIASISAGVAVGMLSHYQYAKAKDIVDKATEIVLEIEAKYGPIYYEGTPPDVPDWFDRQGISEDTDDDELPF